MKKHEIMSELMGRYPDLEKDFVLFEVVREAQLVFIGHPDEDEYRLSPNSFWTSPEANTVTLVPGWYAVYRPWDETVDRFVLGGPSGRLDELTQGELVALVELGYVRLETDEGT